MRERQRLADGIETVEALQREANDAEELLELAEGDDDMIADIEANLKKAAARAEKAELAALLSGEADGNDCFIQINAAQKARTGPISCAACMSAGPRRTI